MLREALDRADTIITAARKAGRPLTDDEREYVKRCIDQADADRDAAAFRDEIDRMRRGDPVDGSPPGWQGPGLGQKLIQAGFHAKSRPSVELSAYAALGAHAKTATLPPTPTINPTDPAWVPIGRDSRFLWPALPRADAGTNTAVADFRQTARAVTGAVERAIDATTTKAELDVTLTAVSEPMKQLAVTIRDIPNAILEAESLLRQFLNSEGRFVVERELDAHVERQIVAAAPPFGNTGTGLVAQVRNGVTAMRAEGANPSVLVVNAADAAALDLTTDAGGYVFPLSQTGGTGLWGLRVIERPGTTPPYLIDPAMLGMLYLGGMRFDADPYTGFTRNLTTLRVEVNALFHVRDARGARRIAAT
ncbi:hypothetical protein DQ238_01245 [Geodermatophilus sp. TF02-6]|nr:hypothetical protein DQ238_01245 [Geodermatophilus sp. TF02-6]